jgi:hypothetical protein
MLSPPQAGADRPAVKRVRAQPSGVQLSLVRNASALAIMLFFPGPPAPAGEVLRPPAARDLRVYLTAENGSAQTGVAILSRAGRRTRVTISLAGEPADALQPANVYAGRCGGVETIACELQSVRGGRSRSNVAVPFDRFAASRLVVNIEASVASLHAAKDARDVSCGAIGKPGPGPGFGRRGEERE